MVGERGHMNIPILVEKLGVRGRRFFAILAELVALGFASVILVYGGLQITNLAMGQMTSALGLPIGVFYVVLPISGGINILYTILNIIDIATDSGVAGEEA